MVGNHQNARRPSVILRREVSAPVARLNGLVTDQVARSGAGAEEVGRLSASRGTIEGRPDRLLDATALRDWAHAAVGDLIVHIIVHIDEINRLNVYPVADSDTGGNMLFTMRSALAEATAAAGGSGCVVRVAAALSAGALHGARGNSGVILSQILRGIAEVAAVRAADSGGELAELDAAVLGAALHHAVDLVVASMGGREMPGTIVSVLRGAADGVAGSAPDGLAAAGDAAVVALEMTTEPLEVLADAGAVDAGGEVLIVAADATAAAIGLLDLLLASGGDLVTVLMGAGIAVAGGDSVGIGEVLWRHAHDHHPGAELVTYDTGHRGDVLLIGVE